MRLTRGDLRRESGRRRLRPALASESLESSHQQVFAKQRNITLTYATPLAPLSLYRRSTYLSVIPCFLFGISCGDVQISIAPGARPQCALIGIPEHSGPSSSTVKSHPGPDITAERIRDAVWYARIKLNGAAELLLTTAHRGERPGHHRWRCCGICRRYQGRTGGPEGAHGSSAGCLYTLTNRQQSGRMHRKARRPRRHMSERRLHSLKVPPQQLASLPHDQARHQKPRYRGQRCQAQPGADDEGKGDLRERPH